ncbi:MAG TPA: ArsR family transcriptional regulator [Cyanobacteria bacterium UBA9971]|nr:ArsR family transcriptional regulator [Cyanobacteria bacterium UBA9971]
MEKPECKEMSEIFKALSHPIRLKIVCGLIQKKECNVTKMVTHLNMPQPNVSQHINILKNADIIEGYRKGNEICYRVTNKIVEKIIESLEMKE